MAMGGPELAAATSYDLSVLINNTQ